MVEYLPSSPKGVELGDKGTEPYMAHSAHFHHQIQDESRASRPIIGKRRVQIQPHLETECRETRETDGLQIVPRRKDSIDTGFGWREPVFQTCND